MAFAVLLLLITTTSQGGFAVNRWAPLALFVLAVLLGVVVLGRRAVALAGPTAIALGGIWGLTAFSLVSMVWAQSSGDAFAAGDRMLLYAAIVTLPFVLPLGHRSLSAAAWAISAGLVVVALITLLQLLGGDDSLFLAGRLNGPVNYRNATALLFAMPVWPMVMVAARRTWHRSLRAFALAGAVLCLGLVFLAQSRGILLGLAAGGIVAVIGGPDRVRRCWLAILSIGLIAVGAQWLLRPFHAFDGGNGYVAASDIAVAARALGLLTLLALALGFAFSLFDRGLRAGSPRMRHVDNVARGGLALVGLLALVSAGAAIGNPVSFARHEWDQFTNLNYTTPTSTRYASVGGQRYDLWRVAVKEWEGAPLLGVGADNYWFGYYRYRRTDRNLSDPHSLFFALLSETGLIGIGLFGAFLAGLTVTFVRGWRGLEPARRVHAVAPAAAGVVLLGQSAVDWIWLIPGLTAVGLLLLALAAAQFSGAAEAGRSEPAADQASPSHRRGRSWIGGTAGRFAAAGGLIVALLAVLALYLSNAYVDHARVVDTDPAAKLAAARTAAWLDPWWATPHYLEASALESMGRRPASSAQLQAALSLEPRNFATLAVIGDFEVRGHQLAVARGYYRRALALDPLDTGLQQLARIGVSDAGRRAHA